jgi:hypothetical protein
MISSHPAANSAFSPGVLRGQLVDKIAGLSMMEQIVYGSYKPNCVLQVFQVPVPLQHVGKALGPRLDSHDGVNLRAEYGMHAIAIETQDKQIDFDVCKDHIFEQGDFLWFGFESDECIDLQALKSICFHNLLRFLGRAEKDGVSDVLRHGEMPLIETPVPCEWYRRTLLEIDSRSKYGITIVALGVLGAHDRLEGNVTHCFPNPKSTRFAPGSSLFVSVLSIRNLRSLMRRTAGK